MEPTGGGRIWWVQGRVQMGRDRKSPRWVGATHKNIRRKEGKGRKSREEKGEKGLVQRLLGRPLAKGPIPPGTHPSRPAGPA